MEDIQRFPAACASRPKPAAWTRGALVVSLCILLSSPCFANDEDDARKEVAEVATQCRNNVWFSTYLECGCVEREFKQTRQAEGWGLGKAALLEKVQDRCPNKKQVILNYVESNCFETFKNTRTDAYELCRCTADRVSTAFVNKPNSNVRHVERLRKDALTACGVGKATAK
ncbi:MAG: hypothetical protein EON54_24705 [Alcaligenaceae bacterium]|nr:MAG: hypothetical protein EON54_24705 [Alcaligenaceae bacterium]